MKRQSGLPGILIFTLLLGACFGYVFLRKKEERRYSEILIHTVRGQDLGPLHKLANDYGFKVQPRKLVVGPNEFTRKNRILSLRKYDLDPAKLNGLLAELEQMKGEGRLIAAVEPNFLVSAFRAPVNDPLYDRQWNLARLRMEEVWKKADGSGVTVAVIDTGVGKSLADLDPARLVKGYNFVARNEDFDDDHGHGSHVAGTIAQDTDNGIGVAGIAPKAKIMPLKVLSQGGSGSTLDIAEAIVYAADNGAQIINMSLGGGGYTKVLKDACDYAHRKGVIVIAAAGNEGDAASAYPGRYSTVLSVAAADERDGLAPYSNYGEGVDLIAPGGDTSGSMRGGILQNAPSFLGDRHPHEVAGSAFFYYFQGTSMAAPHVAGIAALLYQRGVRTPDEMKDLLLATAQPGPQGLPYINPLAALERAGSAREAPRREKAREREAAEGPVYRLNAGAVATTPLHSGIVLGFALALAILFNVVRKKHRAMERMLTPLLFTGLLLGATGLSFLGFLQEHAPFTALPERFSGLLFNSPFDYDRVLFFLTKPSLLWHNFLVAAALMVLLNFRDERKRRFTIGLLLGFTAKLLCEGIFVREVTWLPSGAAASAFLIVNALIVFVFPFVMAKNE
jgi:serine protease